MQVTVDVTNTTQLPSGALVQHEGEIFVVNRFSDDEGNVAMELVQLGGPRLIDWEDLPARVVLLEITTDEADIELDEIELT